MCVVCVAGSVEYTVDVMDSLCENRLDVVIQSCNELVQTGVSPGPLADTIVKVCVTVCGCVGRCGWVCTCAYVCDCVYLSCLIDPCIVYTCS